MERQLLVNDIVVGVISGCLAVLMLKYEAGKQLFTTVAATVAAIAATTRSQGWWRPRLLSEPSFNLGRYY